MPTPFPRLDTPRLVLREIALADVPRIVALASDYDITKNTLSMPHPYHEDDALRWLHLARHGFQQQETFMFAIELKAGGEFAGGIGLTLDRRFDRAEAGYWLGKAYWGQGLMSEALAALLRYGFEELKLNKIFATHIPSNLASGQVMLKNGMVKEGELVQHTKRDGQYQDLWQYRLTQAEYARQRQLAG